MLVFNTGPFSKGMNDLITMLFLVKMEGRPLLIHKQIRTRIIERVMVPYLIYA